MAKINANGARQIGPTLYTERWMRDGTPIHISRCPYTGRDAAVCEDQRFHSSCRAAGQDHATRYYQAWRLRSDGAVLERIVWTESENHSTSYRSGGHPGRLGHNSAPSIRGRFPHGPNVNIDALRGFLSRHNYEIVKEA
jgi:hypothetical protein